MRTLDFLLFATLCGCASSQPGFKTTISQTGVTYFKDVGMKILEERIGNLNVADQSGEADTPVGHVDWDLTNIKITGIQFPQTSISIVANSGFDLSLSGLSCSVSLDWHYRKTHWPHVSDHGTADISVSGSSATCNLKIITKDSRPYFEVISDAVDIGDLSIHLHGGASWLYKIFVDIFSHKIKDGINTALTNAITTNINTGVNQALSTLPISEDLSREVEVDFPLVSDIVFDPKYFTLPQLGEFYMIGNHKECPSKRVPLPDYETSQMAQMMIGDFVANSALFVFYQIGKVAATVRDSDLPSWAPIRLNTTAWKYLIPNLYTYYPNMLMEIKIYAIQPPLCDFTPSGPQIDSIGNIDVFVAFPNGTLAPVFSLNGSLDGSALVQLKDTTLFVNMTYLRGNFGLRFSNVGNINVATLDDLLNVLFSKGVIPLINQYLASGFPLPTVKGVTFVNPGLAWHDGYMDISTDITYQPQKASRKDAKKL